MDFQVLAEDALYRNLDKLHTQRVAIEAALAEREKTLFGLDQTVFLYDVTSTFFEGLRAGQPQGQTWLLARSPVRLQAGLDRAGGEPGRLPAGA